MKIMKEVFKESKSNSESKVMNQSEDLNIDLLEPWKSFLSFNQIHFQADYRSINIESVKLFFDENELIKYRNIKDLQDSLLQSDANKVLLNTFIKRLSSDDLSVNLVSSAVEDNYCSIYVDYEDVFYSCQHSFCPAHGRNIMMFTSAKRSAEPIFLIQHVSVCDAVFIPHLQFMHRLGHTTLDVAIDNVQELFLAYLYKKFTFSGDKTFGGIIASHSRPYHYYYDVALALRLLFKKKLLNKVPKFFQMKAADFLPVSDMFNLMKGKDSVVHYKFLNKQSLAHKEFYIKVGLLKNLDRHKKMLDDLDLNLLAAANRYRFNTKQVQIFNFFDSFHPVLWIGLTGQKRAWKEEVEAQVAFLNGLQRHFFKLTVVFDGWTYPFTPTKHDKNFASQDLKIMNKIKSKLNPEIKCVSVIGENSLVKLKVAQNCDFFIANQATGSMHICRMAKVKGITHISQSFFDVTLRQQRLENAIFFPKPLIKDLSSNKESRIDFVNYSIAVKDFLSFSLPIAIEHIESLDKWKLRRHKVDTNSKKFSLQRYRTNITKKQLSDKIYLQETGLFDSFWYLMTYPDVADAGMDAIEHFVRFGVTEKRNPTDFFDLEFYLNRYQDVSKSSMNPFIHYLKFGLGEGRVANAQQLS